eukprot:scaffold1042_cov401-Prasinococcus_capsulatus_cf.AAC.55
MSPPCRSYIPKLVPRLVWRGCQVVMDCRYVPDVVMAAKVTVSRLVNEYGKPVIISETGAGAISGWKSNSTEAQWGEPYQAKLLLLVMQMALESDELSGICMWQFSDTKANDGNTKACAGRIWKARQEGVKADYKSFGAFCARPGGLNNKVRPPCDALDGEKKLAFNLIRELVGNPSAYTLTEANVAEAISKSSLALLAKDGSGVQALGSRRREKTARSRHLEGDPALRTHPAHADQKGVHMEMVSKLRQKLG